MALVIADQVAEDLLRGFAASIRDERWRHDALCVEYPDVEWFPSNGRNAGEAARAVCARCLVRRECAEYATQHEVTHGIWGGLTAVARKKARSEAA